MSKAPSADMSVHGVAWVPVPRSPDPNRRAKWLVALAILAIAIVATVVSRLLG